MAIASVTRKHILRPYLGDLILTWLYIGRIVRAYASITG
jgi:hypothetical protein